ncbi:hypothetical protein ABRY17_06160 [Clostridioides difficile]
MKTRNEIIKDLEDRLFILKFTRFEEVDIDKNLGCIAAINSCIEKHKKGWTLGQFKEHLEKEKKVNMYGDYVDGFILILEKNVRDMERGGIGSK